MRQIVLTLLIILSLPGFYSCKKCHVDPSNAIIGNWELRKTSGGLSGTTTVYPLGSGYTLKFTGNTYEWYDNGQLFRNGTYSIVNDTSREEFSYKLVLNYQSYTAPYYLKFVADQIVLSEYAVADGYDHLYQRIQ